MPTEYAGLTVKQWVPVVLITLMVLAQNPTNVAGVLGAAFGAFILVSIVKAIYVGARTVWEKQPANEA